MPATPPPCCSSQSSPHAGCTGTAAHTRPHSLAASVGLRNSSSKGCVGRQRILWQCAVESPSHHAGKGLSCKLPFEQTFVSTWRAQQSPATRQRMLRWVCWRVLDYWETRGALHAPASSSSLHRSLSSICTVGTLDTSCPYTSRRATTCAAHSSISPVSAWQHTLQTWHYASSNGPHVCSWTDAVCIPGGCRQLSRDAQHSRSWAQVSPTYLHYPVCFVH